MTCHSIKFNRKDFFFFFTDGVIFEAFAMISKLKNVQYGSYLLILNN